MLQFQWTSGNLIMIHLTGQLKNYMNVRSLVFEEFQRIAQNIQVLFTIGISKLLTPQLEVRL
ncbi:hypothetical protein ES703_46689 [subsurface metagenome]